MTTATHLAFRWSISRARDTYGYNVLTLTDQATGKKYRCSGGGYDMVGTVIGMYLQDQYQDRLIAISTRAGSCNMEDGAGLMRNSSPDALYGMLYTSKGAGTGSPRVYLDGACGDSSMLAIAKAIGLTFERTYIATGRRRGETTGYIVTDGGQS